MVDVAVAGADVRVVDEDRLARRELLVELARRRRAQRAEDEREDDRRQHPPDDGAEADRAGRHDQRRDRNEDAARAEAVEGVGDVDAGRPRGDEPVGGDARREGQTRGPRRRRAASVPRYQRSRDGAIDQASRVVPRSISRAISGPPRNSPATYGSKRHEPEDRLHLSTPGCRRTPRPRASHSTGSGRRPRRRTARSRLHRAVPATTVGRDDEDDRRDRRWRSARSGASGT